jgi:hypothetical protein
LQQRIEEDSEFFSKATKGSGASTLLLVDRREDPVSPLLNQWTYQAMIHEIVGIENNKVHLDSVAGSGVETSEVVLSSDQDQFFRDHMYCNFGEMSEALNNLVLEYQEKTKSQAKVESIQDMQRFVENFPEFTRQSGHVTKHVNVMSELSKTIEARQLLDVSRLEQDMISADSRNDQYKQIVAMIEDPSHHSLEKLRLVLIYALKYEKDDKVK